MKKYEAAFIEIVPIKNDVIVMSDVDLKYDGTGLSGETSDNWF